MLLGLDQGAARARREGIGGGQCPHHGQDPRGVPFLSRLLELVRQRCIQRNQVMAKLQACVKASWYLIPSCFANCRVMSILAFSSSAEESAQWFSIISILCLVVSCQCIGSKVFARLFKTWVLLP